MQRLHAVFQVSITALICLSACIFSAAEGTPLGLLTIPVAVFALISIDRANRRGIPPLGSFILGLCALSAAAWELATGTLEARILAPAHLLIYLLWIVVLQRKETRHYWILLGLTVLQVAIAALLTTEAWLGVVLIVYATLAMWSMAIFTLHRAVLRVGLGTIVPGNSAGKSSQNGFSRSPHSLESQSNVRNSVQLDPAEQLVGWRFTGGALLMTVLSLALSAAFFLFIPRIWPNQSRLFQDATLEGARPLTGFAEEVTLGDMGAILENDDLVMEVQLYDNDTDTLLGPDHYASELGSEDPLFRGQVMETYLNSRWQRLKYIEPAHGRTIEGNMLRQRIRLQPIGTQLLFAAGRALLCQPVHEQDWILPDKHSGTFRRHDDSDIGRPFEYDALCSRLEPAFRGIHPEYRLACLKLPDEGMERLEQLADDLVENLPDKSPSKQAERLLSYLRDSGEFTYSLDLSVQDPNVDPVIDFLFNRRRGHCEYYASALALMLRARGIPSRVVSGFKGGQFNSRTGQFEVRQLHAHAWVEAYLDWAWVPLDPTPEGRDESVAQLQEQTTSSLARFRESWERAWSQGVRLSRADQDRLVYQPIQEAALAIVKALRDLRGTSSNIGRFIANLVKSPDRWFSWRGGLAAFVLLLLAALLYSLLRRVWSLLRRFSRTSAELRRSAAVVPFYERFRRAAARAGYRRSGTQTPREFAESVSRRLQLPQAPVGLIQLPRDVTEQYYRIRFGNESPPPEVLEQLQRRLDQFEQELAGARPTAKLRGATS